MGSFAFVLSLTVVLFCAFIVNLAARPKTASRLTCTALVITGVGGLLCYSYGYSAVLDNIPLGVIRATLSSVGMFLGRNDISSVSEAPFFQTQLGLTLLWVLHLIALYTTASAAIITIGASILRRIRLVLARRGDLVLIYGSHEGALAFGRQMMDRRNSSVVFVDESPVVGSEDAIRGMGSLLRQDSAALHPDHRFLRSLGIRSGGRQVTLYALSKIGSDNMRYASDFLKALETDSILSRQTRLVLLGREDGWESAFSTDKGYGYGSVTMMDEAEMAGRLLVRRMPPCQVLSFSEEGLAREDFRCLVVGFGRVGQAVLRNLTINAQFAGSTFHAAVFAPDCEDVSGYLSRQSPQLLQQYDISFFNCDARSRRIYDYLENEGRETNYMVICAGNEKINQEIAGELMSFLSRRGRDIPVALCGYRGVQLLRRGARNQHWPLYSAQILHGGVLDHKAQILNQAYCSGNGLTAEENWRKCDYFSRMSCRAAADFSPAFLAMAGMTAEDVARKGWAPQGELLENLARTEHLRWCAFHYAMGFSLMDSQTHLQRAKQRTEDLRRTGRSSLRITKDMQRRLHACLIPWEALDELSRRENAVTGGDVDYQDLDRRNVLALARLLKEDAAGPAEKGA